MKSSEQSIAAALASTNYTNFAEFLETFPLQGENLYSILFERNSQIIQTQKAKFATANLQKILTATFEVSSTSGFDRMSLRDLSRQTGMSMGAIYSCISKKEDIAIMVADIVRLASQMTYEYAQQVDDVWLQLEKSVSHHLYTSTVLQPWYFFLYFETRTLPEAQQQESKQIELGAIEAIEAVIKRGIDQGEFFTEDSHMVANTVVVLLEDWYLKPWKSWQSDHGKMNSSHHELNIKQYTESILGLIRKLVAK